ncbi:MAG TPA: DUF1648 domain-containing protein [Candidatus Choladousia intestinigallinarum]|nr:DUF1648 domain-containing protein [Candidatus Choladousia intestinigallinarum]
MKDKKSLLVQVMDWIGFLLLAGVNLFLGIGWGKFPQEIAGHYNLAGEIDRMAEKSSLLIYLLIIWICFILLTAAERFPRLLGGKKVMSEENTGRILKRIQGMVSLARLLAVGILSYAVVCSAVVRPLGAWFLPGIMIFTFLAVIGFVILIFTA